MREFSIIKTSVQAGQVDFTDGIETLIEEIQKYFREEANIVAYLDYAIKIGTWDGHALSFYQNAIFRPVQIQRMRVFTRDKELFLWRQATGKSIFSWRLRQDNDEQNCESAEVCDLEMLLWGTAQEMLDENWVCLREDRGTELVMPQAAVSQNRKNIAVITRNYLDCGLNNQAGYIDSRLVGWGGR